MARSSAAQQMPQVRYSTTKLGGGVTPTGVSYPGGYDLTTPSLTLQPGALRDMLNFECSQSGGYGRIGGYERFDGHLSPSDATYQIVQVDTFVNVPTVGQIIEQANSGATGTVALVNNSVTADYLIVTDVTGNFNTTDTISGSNDLIVTAANSPFIVQAALKPAPWAFNPALVDPIWKVIWANGLAGFPFWEGSGNTIADVVTGRTVTGNAGLPTVWSTSSYGIALDNNLTGDQWWFWPGAGGNNPGSFPTVVSLDGSGTAPFVGPGSSPIPATPQNYFSELYAETIVASNSRYLLVSMWVNLPPDFAANGGLSYGHLFGIDAEAGLGFTNEFGFIYVNPTEIPFFFNVSDSSARTNHLQFTTFGIPDITPSVWHHLIVSIDTNHPAGSKIVQFYIDGVPLSITGGNLTDTSPAFDILLAGKNFTGAFFGDGATQTGIAGFAQYYISAPGAFFDLSVPANLAKFIDASGNPVNPIGAGAPSPLIYNDGDKTGFPLNQGTAGALAIIGNMPVPETFTVLWDATHGPLSTGYLIIDGAGPFHAQGWALNIGGPGGMNANHLYIFCGPDLANPIYYFDTGIVLADNVNHKMEAQYIGPTAGNPNATWNIYQDDILAATVATGATPTFQGLCGFLENFNNPPPPVVLSEIIMFEGLFTAGQRASWNADPFGPFRQAGSVHGPVIVPFFTTIGDAIPLTFPLTSQIDAQFTAAAADIFRADIDPVPGSGAVLDVIHMVFNGEDNVYAFRANAANNAVLLWKATTSGWVQVPFFNTVAFTAGGAAIPLDGDTLTQGSVTATIQRVVWQSGDWTGTAIGNFVTTTPASGNFTAGPATTSTGATVTLSGEPTPITMLPGGTYEHVKCNFSGQLVTRRIYGCDGVNMIYEFDGVTLTPIPTGLSPDHPSHIYFHKNFLFVAQVASLFYCGVGSPFKWDAIDGGGEIATGDTVNAMLTLPGSQTTATLAVFLQTNTSFLYGTDPTTFNYVTFNNGLGGLPRTAQNLFDSFVLDNLGVITLKTTLNWGNFLPSTLTKNILPFIIQERSKISCSSVMRDKSQYRVFFDDGLALWVTMINQQYLGSAVIQFPNPVSCCDNDQQIDGTEVTYFGSSDGQGYVYQMDVGTSFDGANLDAHITLAWDPIKSPRILKRFRAGSIEVQGDSYAEISFGYQLGYGSANIGQPTPITNSSGFISAPVWDQFTWDNFIWDGFTLMPTDVDMTGTAENVQVTISSGTNYIAPYNVNSVIYHYTGRRGIRV